MIVEDDESDVTNTEVDSGDVNAGNADRHASPNNTVQTLDPAFGPSKPIDPPYPRRWDDVDDECFVDDDIPSGLRSGSYLFRLKTTFALCIDHLRHHRTRMISIETLDAYQRS